MSQKDNSYIKLLEYAKSKLDIGVTLQEGIYFLRKNTIIAKHVNNPDDEVLKKVFFQVFDKSIYSSNYQNEKEKPHYFMNVEAYFKYLEHEELEEARVSAKQARTYAIIAIFISAFFGLISFILGVIQAF